MNEHIRFPYYSGNIYDSEAKGIVTLDRFIHAHWNPNNTILDTLNKIEDAGNKGLVKLKRTLKQQLFTFTPSVYIPVGAKRSYGNVKNFTGLMQLDFDKIEDYNTAYEIKEHLYAKNPEVVCAYLSPSKRGVKAIIRTTQPKDLPQYKALHKAVTDKYEGYGYFDEATKNAVLPLFISYDKGILYRDYADCTPWTDEDWSQEEYVQLVDNDGQSVADTSQAPRVARITENRINSIVDNGHPQLRDAALVLGSRVGAGYLSQFEAENLINRLIDQNQYLQKGKGGYKRTAMWGIREGMKRPKFFKND